MGAKEKEDKIRYRVCLFDMDGTLIDSEPVWIDAIVSALAGRGVNVPRDVVERMEYGRAWQDIFEDIKRQWPGVFSTREEMQVVTGAYYERVTAERDISIPGSVRLLKRLHGNGYQTAIVSGSTKERIFKVVRQLGIEGCIERVVGCGDYVKGKPDPESYLTAARLMGVSPGECIVFEDATPGIRAARAAGMYCVALRGTAGQCLDGANQLLDDLDSFEMASIERKPSC